MKKSNFEGLKYFNYWDSTEVDGIKNPNFIKNSSCTAASESTFLYRDQSKTPLPYESQN
jgi:hypothetical protein